MVLERRPFYFLRHGQTDWNVEQRCVGQADVPLNETGIAQAKAAASKVRALQPSAVFHSPLDRARQTAFLISADRSWPMFSEGDLREVCLGVKEGRLENAPYDDFVSAWQNGLQIEGAETFASFRRRVVAAVNNCLSKAAVTPPLIVAHSGVFMALASACGLCGEEIDHCRPYRFSTTNTVWSLQLIG
jgi:probable phosphoglycerate mutase